MADGTGACSSYDINSDIKRDAGSDFAADRVVLGRVRREALQVSGLYGDPEPKCCDTYFFSPPQGMSGTGYRLFESGKVQEALSLANTFLIPALKAFSLRPCDGDEVVLEMVKSDWCNCLIHPSLSEGERRGLVHMFLQCL